MIVALTPDEAEQALCAQTDPDAFHPAPGDFSTAQQAKAICASCPIGRVVGTGRCLEVALANAWRDGIYDGTTGTERRKMLRTEAAA